MLRTLIPITTDGRTMTPTCARTSRWLLPLAALLLVTPALRAQVIPTWHLPVTQLLPAPPQPGIALQMAPVETKSLGRALALNVGVNLFVWGMNKFVLKYVDVLENGDTVHWPDVSWESWKTNFHEGFNYDDNAFSNNQIAHPYHGSLYYNGARANGFGYWESMPFAFLGSFMWEYMGETWRPAYNDWLNTSVGGIALGEMTYRFSSTILDNTATGSNRTMREFFGALVSPVRGFNRLITGQMFQQGPNPEDRIPKRYEADAVIGLRRIAEGESLSDGRNQVFIGFDFRYGDPFDPEFSKPFQAFSFGLQANSNDAKKIGQAQVRGVLTTRDLHRSERAQLVIAATQNYDYVNQLVDVADSSKIELGGQSFGVGLLYHRALSSTWDLASSLQLNATVIGAFNSEHAEVVGRTYDYGPGASGYLDLRFRRKGFQVARLNLGSFFVHTTNGAEGDHIANLLTLDLRAPIRDPFGVGVSGTVLQRNSYYRSFPDSQTRNPMVKAFVVWALSR